MMRRLSFFACAALLLGIVLSLPSSAGADTIAITAGTLVGEPAGARVHLEGSGLVLDGSGDVTGGRWDLGEFCRGTPDTCGAGATASLFARWADHDFQGTATLRGRSFPLGMQTSTHGSALVEFSGSTQLPVFTGVERITLTAPFAFNGSVLTPIDEATGMYATVFLTGRGTATINMIWNTTAGGAWQFEHALYRFSAADPVPEPATMLLVASGIAALALRRRDVAHGRHVRTSARPHVST
jgi:hypothetical protein